jgi:nitrite reductase/ring-hydroxylating ferredoxin subunit
MLAMLSVVTLFAIAWFVRDGSTTAPPALSLALEAVGAVMLGIGGWMGGTLVGRNLISVDHRYAEAGRWKEAAYRSEKKEPVVVAGIDELKVNQMKLLHIDGQRIVLGRTEDGYVAFDDSCTHKGGSLAGGAMICGTVQCLWHGSQFDVATGEVKSGPARKRIGTYDVTEKDGKVMLALRAAPSRERARSHQET